MQLATFVLFGAFWDGPGLRDLLLDLCADDLQFAHRVEWYLLSFADASEKSPGLRLTPEGERAVRALRRDAGPHP